MRKSYFHANYFLTDHLGSTRVVVDDSGNPQNYDRSDYFPFGQRWTYSGVGGAATQNRWLYNGKEHQAVAGLNFLDYGARQYDPILGRWHSEDPLAEKYYPWSPYNYTTNNPLKYIDPDGKKIVLSIKNKEKQPVNYHYSPQAGVVNPQTGESVYLRFGTKAHAIVTAYNEVYATDNVFQDQINGLVNSPNDHFIVIGGPLDNGKNSVSPGGPNESSKNALADAEKGIGINTTTAYEFSEKMKDDLKERTGIEHTNGSIVSHEVRHQSDFNKGKMGDSIGKSGANDPSESRAVENENIFRSKKGLEERRGYYGNFKK